MAGTLRDRLRAENDLAKKFHVLEMALLGRIKESARLNAAVQYALEEFACMPSVPRVDRLAREVGLSRRRFTQLFREQIGLTPKLFCRARAADAECRRDPRERKRELCAGDDHRDGEDFPVGSR